MKLVHFKCHRKDRPIISWIIILALKHESAKV